MHPPAVTRAFTPAFFIRPAVLGAAFVYTLSAQLTAAWLVVEALAYAEMAWTSRALAKAAGRKLPPILIGISGLAAWLAAPGRILAGFVVLWAWALLVPVWCVNRDRFRAMRARRRAAVVEQVIEEAETMTAWGRATSALKILRGARPPADAPPPPAPPPAAEALSSVELSAPGEELAFVHGIRRTLPDGSCVFEELPA